MPNTRFAARAKMIGKFKSGTNCSFNITPCQQMAIAIAKPFVKSFRTVMENPKPLPFQPCTGELNFFEPKI